MPLSQQLTLTYLLSLTFLLSLYFILCHCRYYSSFETWWLFLLHQDRFFRQMPHWLMLKCYKLDYRLYFLHMRFQDHISSKILWPKGGMYVPLELHNWICSLWDLYWTFNVKHKLLCKLSHHFSNHFLYPGQPPNLVNKPRLPYCSLYYLFSLWWLSDLWAEVLLTV